MGDPSFVTPSRVNASYPFSRNFFVRACAVSSFLKAPSWTEKNGLRGGRDADSDGSEEGCPGGLVGTGDAGAGVSVTIFPGDNCDFDPAPGGEEVTGDAGTGVSATLFPGGNTDFDPAPGGADGTGEGGAGVSTTLFPGGNTDVDPAPAGADGTGEGGAGVSATIFSGGN